MLVIEIAAGVLLGLLAYRGIDSYCTKRNLTVTAAVLLNFLRLLLWTAILVGIAGVMFAFYSVVTHPRWLSDHEPGVFIGIVIFLTVAFLVGLRSDIREGRKYKVVADRTACDKCGEKSLEFTGFKDGYKSGVGSYDHPKAKCSGCGHEQMLVPLAD